MEIRINEKTLDVNLDTEKTIGDVLTGLEQWLTNCGHRLSELNIDGACINASMIEKVFLREIDTVKFIDIKTNSISELTAASLLNLLEDINEYEGLNFDEKAKFFEKWKESATAGFLYAETSDLYAFCVSTFSGGSMDTKTLISITEEIQREVNDPVNEIIKLQQIINDVCEKLIELPLDIQTGKDAQAAKTIQIFSAVTEKIFRIFRQLFNQGYLLVNDISLSGSGTNPLNDLIIDFSKILKDLLDAYEKNDSVLVGDLTEYEASPKLKALYAAILENIKNQAETKNNNAHTALAVLCAPDAAQD